MFFVVNTLLSFEVSKYILANVGDEFCNLVQQEEKAFFLQNSKGYSEFLYFITTQL